MDSNHLGRRGVMNCDLASCRKELMNTSRDPSLDSHTEFGSNVLLT